MCYNFWCVVEVYYSSIKHHKSKRIVELKERKILEILKNNFGQFYKLNSQLHTSYGLKINFKLVYNFISITTFMNTTFLYCKYAILNLSNFFLVGNTSVLLAMTDYYFMYSLLPG